MVEGTAHRFKRTPEVALRGQGQALIGDDTAPSHVWAFVVVVGYPMPHRILYVVDTADQFLGRPVTANGHGQ